MQTFFNFPVRGKKHAPGDKMTFIDLFAGIGGFRLGMERAGFRCVFSSEIDRFARFTYLHNHGDTPRGDIRVIREEDIPDHDVLVAGFPCQSFSRAGVSKLGSLGREHGFLDKTRGTLFFEVARILNAKRPKAFILENVKNLISHDRGRTFSTILATLGKSGYIYHHKVINGSEYVPQNRERIFIVGFKDPKDSARFQFPESASHNLTVRDILEHNVPGKYTKSDKRMAGMERHKARHAQKKNGFGYRIVDPDGSSPTIPQQYYKDGLAALVPQVGRNPRMFTPRECARLMGFPDDFKIVVSDTQAYRQFGNSVVVPLMQRVASAVRKALERYESDSLNCRLTGIDLKIRKTDPDRKPAGCAQTTVCKSG